MSINHFITQAVTNQNLLNASVNNLTLGNSIISGSTTINPTCLGYLSSINQDLETSSSPSFYGLELKSDSKSIINISSTTNPNIFYINTQGSSGPYVEINGDLNVNGNITYTEVTQIESKNPLIYLAYGNTGNSLDIGFYGQYNTSTYCGIFKDHVSGIFKTFDNLTTQPSNTIPAGYSLAPFECSNLYGTISTISQPNITTLDNLTSIQGQNIGNGCWLYVNELNQNLSTTASPTFTIVNADLNGNALTSTSSASSQYVTNASQPNITTLLSISSIGSDGVTGYSQNWLNLSSINQNLGTSNSPVFNYLSLSNGNASSPSFTFSTDSSSGLFGISGNIYIGVSGNTILTTNSSGILLNAGVAKLPSGTVTVPSLNLGDSGTGFFRNATNQVSFTSNGVNQCTFGVTGSGIQMQKTLDLNSNNITNGGTITAGSVVSSFIGNLTGNASSASTATSSTSAQYVTNASQSYITSVGTLTGLSISSTGSITIGSNNIGNAGWGYLSSINQNLGTTASPTFATITGNLSGNASSATSSTTAGTVTNASQPNITSVGTLSSLSIGGNITASSTNSYSIGTLSNYFSSVYSGFIYALNGAYKTPSLSFINYSGYGLYCDGTNVYTTVNQVTTLQVGPTSQFNSPLVIVGNLTPSVNNTYTIGASGNNWNNSYITNMYGSIATPSQTGITAVGTLTGLTMGGTLVMGSNAITSSGNVGGTLTTASQPNITSLGNLTSLTMSGSILPSTTLTYNLGSSSYNWAYCYFGAVSCQSVISSGNVNAGSITTGAVTLQGTITPYVNNTYSIGTASYQLQNLYANNIYNNNFYLSNSGNLYSYNGGGGGGAAGGIYIAGNYGNFYFNGGSAGNSWNIENGSGIIFSVSNYYSSSNYVGVSGGNVYPSVNGQGNIGISSNYWANSYIGNENCTNLSVSNNINYGVTFATSATTLAITSGGNIVKQSSSRRYKENITDLSLDTSKIFNLQPREYDFKSDKLHDFGFIAEEVNEVMPELVYRDEKGIPESVHYDKLSILLLQEVIKLRNRIDILEKMFAYK